MKQFLQKVNLLEKIILTLILLINLTIIFMGRSGQNINILNYRLGEIFIAIAFFVSIYCLFSREIDIIFKLFLLINLINLIFRFSYPTAFRLSSFVWSVSIFFFLNYKLKFNEKLVSYVFYLLFFQNIVYIFSMISEEFILVNTSMQLNKL